MKFSKLLPILAVGMLIIFGSSFTTYQTNGQGNNLIKVAFDTSVGAQHDLVTNLRGNITSVGGSFSEGNSPATTDNVLLLAGPSKSEINSTYLSNVSTWFSGSGPKLLWVAGDSDFGGYFLPGDKNGGANSLLDTIGSQLRLASESIEDEQASDAAAYRVAPNETVSDGIYNILFSRDVDSVTMHGPTAVLGYKNNAVVDLRNENLDNVEVVIKTSVAAIALDMDFSIGEFDYYSSDLVKGNYPMMVFERIGIDKYVVVSGEAIFTDYKFMYGSFTEQSVFNNPDAWNNGVQDGKQLVDNVFDWFGSVLAYPPKVFSSELNFVFDRSRGAQHSDASSLMTNVMFNGGTFDDLATAPGTDTNVLMFAGASNILLDSAYFSDVSGWFNTAGPKLIWVAADSDFGGYFLGGSNTQGSNGLLSSLGSQLRIATESIEDPEANDAAAYRVAPNETHVDGTINKIFNEGVSSVTMHGPTAVLGYNATGVVDLRNDVLLGVEVVITTSPFAKAIDSDYSLGEFDYYSGDLVIGNYPMMVVEDMGDDKYIIVTGEAIFTNYKFMYGINTEQSFYDNPLTWNNGHHDGRILVDNVFHFFSKKVDPDFTVSSPTTTSVSTSTTTSVTTSTTTSSTTLTTTSVTTSTTTSVETSEPTASVALPVPVVMIVAGFVVITILRRKFKN